MSNGITLKNPVVNSVPPAIALGKKAVDDNGRSLSTGLKANIDVVSSFLGNGLADKGKVLSKINESMGYSSNLLRVTMDSLSSMATTLSDMLALTVQSGGSEAAVRSLQDILTQKVEQLENQIKTADYDGRKLLNGDLGSDPSVRTKFSNKPVSVASYTLGNFLGDGVVGKTAINVANNTIATGAAGDKIVIGTVSFSFVGANPDYSKNQILKGNSDLETAQNIVTAIRNSQDETLRLYDVDLFKNTVVISQRSAGSNIPLTVTTTSAGNALVATVPSTQTITFAATATAGDTITVAGETFICRATGGGPYGNNDIDIGANNNGSAAGLRAALARNPVTADLISRGLLTVNAAANNIVTIQSAGGSTMTNLASSNVANAPIVTTAVSVAYNNTVGGIDVTGIKDIDGFIGQLTSTVTLTNYAHGNPAAANLYRQLTGLTVAAGGGNDSTIAMTATIGGKSFQAVEFVNNNVNIAANRVIRFYAQDGSGSSFAVTLANNRDVSTAPNTENNLVNEIKRLLDSATFTQTRDLTINTDAGDITVNGASVASVKGMTVSLTSDDFIDKKFENFAIEAGTNAGSVKLTVTISGTNYVVDNLLPANLIKGLKLDLLPQGGGNSVLSINLGDKGLTSLNDIQNYSPIATAITAALTSSGSGIDVRVGLGFDDSLKVQVPDVSISKLFRDNAGLFVQTLSVLNPADAKIAQDVVTNALATVRSALAKVQGQGETIAAASTSLESSIAVTKDAASGYLDTDLVEAASAFAAALKSILAAISTLQAGARVADAGLEIIKSAAS